MFASPACLHHCEQFTGYQNKKIRGSKPEEFTHLNVLMLQPQISMDFIGILPRYFCFDLRLNYLLYLLKAVVFTRFFCV